jgi:hypothetical protein
MFYYPIISPHKHLKLHNLSKIHSYKISKVVKLIETVNTTKAAKAWEIEKWSHIPMLLSISHAQRIVY